MAQTTTQLPNGRFLVSFSTDGSAWTDSSGSVVSVDAGTVEQMVGSQHTQMGDAAAVVASGKIDPSDTTIRGIWTITGNEAWDLLWTAWDVTGPKVIYFKLSPEGGASGDLEFIAADDAGSAFACPIKSLEIPKAEDNGNVLTFGATLTVPKWVDATIA